MGSQLVETCKPWQAGQPSCTNLHRRWVATQSVYTIYYNLMIHCLLFLYIPVRPLIHIVSLNIKEKEKGASLKELTLRLYTNWQLSSLECEGIAAAQPVEIWSPWEQDVSPKALGALGLSNKLLAVLPSQDGFYYNSWGRYCSSLPSPTRALLVPLCLDPNGITIP